MRTSRSYRRRYPPTPRRQWLQATPAQPSLVMDFASDRYWVANAAPGDPLVPIALSSLATYTGAGRMAVGSNGLLSLQTVNSPRIVFDPVTQQRLGYSAWVRRGNIIRNSGDPSLWTASEISPDGTATAPDGSTVPIWRASTNAASHRLTIPGTGGAAGNTTHSPSIYFFTPPGSDAWRFVFRARAGGGIGQAVQVNCATGTTPTYIQSNPFGGANAPTAATAIAVDDAGGGWWRVQYSGLLSADTTAASQIDVAVFPNVNGSELVPGTANTRIAFWQPQLEQGDRASPPIPTGASAVTATADVMTLAGSNFSRWYNQAGGTFVARVVGGNADAGAYFSANANSANNRNTLARGTGFGTLANCYANTAGAGTRFVPFSIDGASGPGRVGASLVMSSGRRAVSANGGFIATDEASYAMPAVDRLHIGHQLGLLQANGVIESVVYYPQPLPDGVVAGLSMNGSVAAW